MNSNLQEMVVFVPCSVGRAPLIWLLLRFNTSSEAGSSSEDELIGMPPTNEFSERSSLLR
jgi:hypothetical protein